MLRGIFNAPHGRKNMNKQWTTVSVLVLLVSGCLLVVNACNACAGGTCGSGCECDCKYTSHTFLTERPQWQSASPERVSMTRENINKREDGHGGAIQAAVFGGKSLDKCHVAKYFTPFCKSKLLVSNDPEDQPDILSNYFNIQLAHFRSTICLTMEQQVVGFGLEWKQGFWQYRDDQWLWFEISFPVEHVKNIVCLKENVDTTVTTPVTGESTTPINMTEAFRQTAFCYGKIDCRHCNEVTKVADVELKLGYEWLKNDCCFLESYFGALAPAGNRPCARYMFEPIAGHNGHAGILIGGTGSFDFWHAEKRGQIFTFAFDSDARYLFERCERRSFDVKYRPWSRYMQVYTSKEQAQQNIITPGINVFTQKMCVKPRLAVSCNEALILTYHKFQAELGYNFYARQAECVRLACKWSDTVAFRALGSDPGYTNKIQTINSYTLCAARPVADYDQNVITAGELDLESAAHPAVISSTVYGTIGWRWEERKYPTFLGFGGSYEWTDDYSALNRWNAWIKAGVSF